MSSALRNPSLRGKRVFESRNGGYVMYVAEVDFVPDLMMNLARKEIVNGNGSDGSGRGGEGRRAPIDSTRDVLIRWCGRCDSPIRPVIGL